MKKKKRVPFSRRAVRAKALGWEEAAATDVKGDRDVVGSGLGERGAQ